MSSRLKIDGVIPLSSGIQSAVKRPAIKPLPLCRLKKTTTVPVMSTNQFLKPENPSVSHKIPRTRANECVKIDNANLYDKTLHIKNDYCTLIYKYDPVKNIRNFSAIYKFKDGTKEIRTAKNLIEMIGVERFDKVIAAIFTVNDIDLKAKALIALLTPERSLKDASTSTFPHPVVENKRFRVRRRQQPYLLHQNNRIAIKKTVIDPFALSHDINKHVGINYSEMKDTHLQHTAEDTHVEHKTKDTHVEHKTKHTHVEHITKDTHLEHKAANDHDRISCVSIGTLSANISPSQLNMTATEQELPREIDKIIDDKSTISGLSNISITHDMNEIKIQNLKKELIINKTLKRSNPKVLEVTNKKICAENITVNAILPNSQCATVRPISPIDVKSDISHHYLVTKLIPNFEAHNQPASPNIEQHFDNFPPKVHNLLHGVKPEDWFNLLTEDRLRCMPAEDVKLLKQLQMYIDWKYCQIPDEDSNLPIHNAVLKNDRDLLTRQCLILKACKQSVDIGDANFNYSALQMSIVHGGRTGLAEVLLRHGASPLALDDEDRTALHLAAEAPSTEELEILLTHMAEKARALLQEQDLWTPEMENCSSTELTDALFTYAVGMFDSSGFTPLMLAARLGHCEHAMLLLEQIKDAALVADKMAPNSGNTALYLAIEAACHAAEKRGDKSKVPDNFASTIQILIRYGSDPWIENKYNSSIQILVQEFKFRAMNTLIINSLNKNKLRHVNINVDFLDSIPDSKKQVQKSDEVVGCEPFMIVKTESGVDLLNPKQRLRKNKNNVKEEKREHLEVNKGENKQEITEKIKIKDTSILMLMRSPTGEVDYADQNVTMRRIVADKTKKGFAREKATALHPVLKLTNAERATETGTGKLSKETNLPHFPKYLKLFKEEPTKRHGLHYEKSHNCESKIIAGNVKFIRQKPNFDINNSGDISSQEKDVSENASHKPIVLQNLKITNASVLRPHIRIKPLKVKILGLAKLSLPNPRDHTTAGVTDIVQNKNAASVPKGIASE